MTDQQSFFAPPDRSTAEEIATNKKTLSQARVPLDIFDSVPTPMMVLNENRQVLLVNQALLEQFRARGLDPAPGMRPGEALGCIHSCEMPAGCGTSEHCQECGACQAILQAQKGERCQRECRLTLRAGEELQALEVQVTASPLDFQESRFTILSLLDVSHEKRRRALERIFFHDLMNTACVVSGYANLLISLGESGPSEGLERINAAAQRLIEEIQLQRDLVSAEQGDLEPTPEALDPFEALQRVAVDYRTSPLANHLTLETVPPPSGLKIATDPRLLSRILSNMVKNALEATREGGTVCAGVHEQDSGVQFWVQNPGFIPRNLQLQVFQRSFSTKGRNRGLGTYSMKLLAENYLGGRVWFESTLEDGTTFRLWLPPVTPDRTPPEEASPQP